MSQGSFLLMSPADIMPGAKSRTINRLGRQRFLTRSGRNLLLNLLHLQCLVRARIHPLSDQGVFTPLPKCSPPKCIKNDLRPVTLTSQIAKIFESFTLAPIINQGIDKIDLKQFALPGGSTTHALVYLLHCLLEAFDNGTHLVYGL